MLCAKMFAQTYIRTSPSRDDLDSVINSKAYKDEIDTFVHLFNATLLSYTFLVESQLCLDIHFPPGIIQCSRVFTKLYN